MGVTMKQIAELANVSRGTVDKVLNNRPGVKPATQEKVMRIVKELHYQPNILGKALVQSKSPTKIGIILTPEFNPYIQELLLGIQKAKEEYGSFGIEIITKMLTTLESAEQLAILNELISQNINGLAIFPLNDTQIISRVNQLVHSNVPVVTFNSKTEGIRSLCFIGQDHYKGGRAAAELLLKTLPGQGRHQVGVIVSSSILSCHHDRLRGFTEKLLECGDSFSILSVQENQDRKEDAFRITLEYCNRCPALDAIYITGGGVAGVGSALEIAEMDHRVRVICHDVTPDSTDLLKKGIVDFILGQDPTEQGYQLVKVLFEYCIKGTTPPREIEIPVTITIKETL